MYIFQANIFLRIRNWGEIKAVEIHQLNYFVAVAETGGFSRAAKSCNVAQPSLSQQIKKLETEIGLPLFDRLGRTIVLTEAGRLLLPRARAVLSEIQDIKLAMRHEIIEGYDRLSVGFIPTIAPFLLPEVLRTFSEKFPHAELSVYENLTDVLVRDLINGTLDIGIMSTPINNKLIATQELFSENLLVASSREHELINRASIKVKELEEFPFIALDEMHCLGEQVQTFCYQQDVNVEIVCHTSQLSTVQSCIALGLGISLVPQMMAATDNSGQVIYRPVSDSVPRRKIVAAAHASRHQSFLTQRFIDLVCDEYSRLVEE
jgi:LysR family hydrogen peroxide-inducible transcriptional activator